MLADAEPARPERVWEGIADYVLANGGCGWNDVDRAVPGRSDYLRRRRDEMLADGVLINGARGQRFELWHRDDPARPTLDTTSASDEGRGVDAAASDPGDDGENRTASPRPLRSRDAGRDAVGSASPADATSADPASRVPSSLDAADARRKEVNE